MKYYRVQPGFTANPVDGARQSADQQLGLPALFVLHFKVSVLVKVDQKFMQLFTINAMSLLIWSSVY